MTPLPKRRISSHRQGRRRATIKLTIPQLVRCNNPACGQLKLPHQICHSCGFYKGQLVNPIKKKKTKS